MFMENVIFVSVGPDEEGSRSKCTYTFKNIKDGQIYKWTTSLKSDYGIYQKEQYTITFKYTGEIYGGAKVISYVKIVGRENRRGSYEYERGK